MKTLVIGGAGYVGSAVVQDLTSRGLKVDVCDLLLRGKPPKQDAPIYQKDYLDLSKEEIKDYDSIILLAGHSSVQMAKEDPQGALRNNLLGLQHIFDIISDQLLIFASSGSVYDGSASHKASETDVLSPPRNVYDLTKSVGDQLAAMSDKRWVGLRFGTVNGPASMMRPELIINRMVLDALRLKRITLANPHAHRAILSIDDLTQAVFMILSHPSPQPGVLNLSSFNATIGSIGETISNLFKVEIVEAPPSKTYDFSMSTARISSLFNFIPEDDLQSIAYKLSDYLSMQERV